MAIVTKGGIRITSLHVGDVGEADLTQLLGEGAVITSAEIKDWFDGWLTPGANDLQDLTTALNIMRVTIRRKDTAGITRRKVKIDIAALLGDGWTTGELFDVPRDGKHGGLVWFLVGETVRSLGLEHAVLKSGRAYDRVTRQEWVNPYGRGQG
jgi:hypothetical protein